MEGNLKDVPNFVSVVGDGVLSNEELELSEHFYGGKYFLQNISCDQES